MSPLNRKSACCTLLSVDSRSSRKSLMRWASSGRCQGRKHDPQFQPTKSPPVHHVAVG